MFHAVRGTGCKASFKQETLKDTQSFTRGNLGVMVQIMKLDLAQFLILSSEGQGVQVEVECLAPESPQTHGQLASHKWSHPQLNWTVM